MKLGGMTADEMETKLSNPKKETSLKRKRPPWNEGLLDSMKDPKLTVLEDELTVAIYDTYPKATFHYLVCCKEDICSIRDVKLKHLELLKHMHEVGKILSSKHTEYNFYLGYHSVPSMKRLHLHVISDDFDSQCLKTKKHWNSFTTDFFLRSIAVIEELEKNGKVSLKLNNEYKVFLDQVLKCHKCEYKPKNMPDLKCHLKTHKKQLVELLATISYTNTKISNFTNSMNESSHAFLQNIKPVRNCEDYKFEYDECKTINSRFYQYYINGEFLDCAKWKEDYINCKKCEKKYDPEILHKIILHENERIDKRIKANAANDVWKKRVEPNPNWNAELPEWIKEQQKNSFKIIDQEDNKQCIIF